MTDVTVYRYELAYQGKRYEIHATSLDRALGILNDQLEQKVLKERRLGANTNSKLSLIHI